MCLVFFTQVTNKHTYTFSSIILVTKAVDFESYFEKENFKLYRLKRDYSKLRSIIETCLII